MQKVSESHRINNGLNNNVNSTSNEKFCFCIIKENMTKKSKSKFNNFLNTNILLILLILVIAS